MGLQRGEERLGLAVSMEPLAERAGERLERPGERWIVAGLLHDMDYEKHPTTAEHPFVAVKLLESRGVDREILDAILGHAQYSGVPRATPMAKTLFAVDELSGFIVACAKVRPTGISDLAASSVNKKLKDKAFAAAVSRDDIAAGSGELGPLTGMDTAQHIQACIDAIRDQRELWTLNQLTGFNDHLAQSFAMARG